MSSNSTMSHEERTYLRELAKRYMEIANLPVMEERRRLWYDHNACRSMRPPIVMEWESFGKEFLPTPVCTSPAAVSIERRLLGPILNEGLICDDKVVSPYFPLDWAIEHEPYGLPVVREHAKDGEGRSLGFIDLHPIHDLVLDLPRLQPSRSSVDREKTLDWKNLVEETLGDILPVRMQNRSLDWYCTPSQRIVELMGLQNMMYAMVDEPDAMHELYAAIVADTRRFIDWLEQEELLTLNNANDYVGSGSYGFTAELPSPDRKPGRVTSLDLWGNLNSQETVGISPSMFHEFVYPYYKEMASWFGLVYYGCCEPVHEIWTDSIRHLHGLRKVSVSAWCDEAAIGESLRSGKVIYSRKPSPNFIGVGTVMDEEAFADSIDATLKAARGCPLEFIQRDVYTLSGDISKAGREVRIIRERIEREGR